MFRMSSIWPIALLSLFLVTFQAMAYVEEQFDEDKPVAHVLEKACLVPIGGESHVLGKQLVEDASSEENDEEVLESSIPEPYRILKPNQPLTDDLNPNRITITVDENDIITAADCI